MYKMHECEIKSLLGTVQGNWIPRRSYHGISDLAGKREKIRMSCKCLEDSDSCSVPFISFGKHKKLDKKILKQGNNSNINVPHIEAHPATSI